MPIDAITHIDAKTLMRLLMHYITNGIFFAKYICIMINSQINISPLSAAEWRSE